MNPSLACGIEIASGSASRRRGLVAATLLATAALGLAGCSREKQPVTTSVALEPQSSQPATQSPPGSPPPAEPNAPSAEYVQQLELARSLLDAHKAEEALVLLERCKSEQPEAFAVHNNLCVAYGILQRKDEAVASCERALKIEPGNQLGKNNLAWVSSIEPPKPVK